MTDEHTEKNCNGNSRQKIVESSYENVISFDRKGNSFIPLNSLRVETEQRAMRSMDNCIDYHEVTPELISGGPQGLDGAKTPLLTRLRPKLPT